MVIDTLQPTGVWRQFAALCAVPHPSHHEEAICRSIAGRARAMGLAVARDGAGNLVIEKPASPGMEGRRGIVLQAHVDMVAQAAPGSGHDFLRDPILPRLDPEDPAWLTATGTTLGADNGIGVAMAMALLGEPGLEHGPLACILTVNEEDGMTGARALESAPLPDGFLLNLDGELENELTIGCAGSVRSYATLTCPAAAAPAGARRYRLSLDGLLGGHSGVDIDKHRANANVELARILSAAIGDCGAFPLSGIRGGDAANVIPRHASADLALEPGREAACVAAVRAAADSAVREWSTREPGFSARLEPADGPVDRAVLPAAASAALLRLLAAIPDGLVAMEPDLPGCIRSSLNLGKVSGAAAGDAFTLDTMVLVRSSSDNEKEGIATGLEAHLGRAGADGWNVSVRRPATLPSWSPDRDSPLLAAARQAYMELFGAEPVVASTHGGLECGLFRPRFPGWDMISIGPTILYPHSPAERVNVASVGRSYRFLVELVRRLG